MKSSIKIGSDKWKVVQLLSGKVYSFWKIAFSLLKLSRPASSVFWFLWHAVAATAIVLISIEVSAKWNLDPNTEPFIGMAVTYCMSVIVLTFYTPKKAQIRLIELTSILLSIFGIFFLFLLVSKIPYSRTILIISLVLVAVFTFLSLSLRTTLQKPALLIATLLVVLVPLSGRADKTRPPELVVENKLIRTSFYNLVARYHRNFVLEEVTGGAISKFGDRYLLATGDGHLHIFSWDQEKKKLESRELSHRIPMNREQFARDAARGKNVNTRVFRTADILVQDFGDDFRLFVSHHYWHSEKQCFTVRVSAIRGSYTKFIAGEESKHWQTLYDSAPCLGFKNKGDAFAGHQIGGKLALLNNDRLLVTVGDHMFDGVESDEILPQDKSAHYGKTMLVSLNTHSAVIYSMGHRNPQGLDVDASGTIWLTEHGPKGGDELNLIVKGKNYGWPLVTYGTNYGQSAWPLNASQGRHDGFELPVHAWVPAIGISAVVSVQGSLLKMWKDDLLVSSLADESIWRVRVDHGRAILTERIKIGERIRDIIEDANGRLILWTEKLNEAPTQTAIVIVEPVLEGNTAMEGLSTVERGELLFARCTGCHRTEDGKTHGIGPDLKGIFERPIASAQGYGYSQALKSVSGKWTEQKMDAFLKNPQEFTPGTSMRVEGISGPTERANLIAYLKHNK